jgi:hypothetical protein
MLRKWTVAIALVLIAVLALGTTAMAQEPAEGPDEAGAPSGMWTKIGVDEEHWYRFHDEGEEDEECHVSMKMVPNGKVAFEVWTEDNLQDWADEEEFDAVGAGSRSCGCEAEDELGRFNWCGSFVQAGDYWVVVTNDNDDVSYYTLDITGKHVTFPTEEARQPAVEAETAEADMAEESLSLAEGEGPDFAVPVTEEWTTLAEGAHHWYDFTYDSDPDYGPLIIRVFADPAEAAVVTVRNEDQARLWEEEGEEEHFGCCTAVFIDEEDDEKEGFMQWAADDLASGHYYIVVGKDEGFSGDIAYRIEVEGEGFISEPVAAAAEAMMPADEQGSGPALAMQITDEEMMLEAGQHQWFAFTYDYDEDHIPLMIRVFADPAEAAVVTVRNADQARLWEQEGEHEHFGCCTAVFIDEEDDEKEGFMQWTADDLASGQYYIVVGLAEGMESPATYHLEITGEGVSS